jgi:DNA mismatch endonuclease (patch repair protein)
MDKLSEKERSENMRQIRSTGMKPEMAVRRMVHRMGYRYRLHVNDLPGRPDLVFPRRRKIIFVHGCFWHQHAAQLCRIVRQPKSNRDYWHDKLVRNAARDRRNRIKLRSLGWRVLVVWECSLQHERRLEAHLWKFLEE